MRHGPWVGLTAAIGVVPLPGCGGRLGFRLVGWVTTGHVRQGALIRVETKAPLDTGLWWLWVPWQQRRLWVRARRRGGGGQ